MRKPVFAANWKMNHTSRDAKTFMRTFLMQYARRPDRTVVFFPPALTLAAVSDAIKERQDILLGVQNIHWELKGAFTGEQSAEMSREAGAAFVLVGHSERRHVFGEKDEETQKKCAAANRAGMTPVLCVGEKLEERERGETDAVVLRQLRAGTASLDPATIGSMIIAYEPVWAIGTGKTAQPEDASAVHAVIRRELAALAGERTKDTPILYGGSANAGNAAALINAANVGGLLVGGASLEPEAWATIVRT
ncbi:MAG: triose-phosphate isomerase [Anaerolineae bacterium]|nr:triose-phosphate isomerase [Gemmatimonadaceae bacterium]